MPTFSCSGCKKQFSGKDELTGRKVKCPKCGTVFVATVHPPAPPKPAPAATTVESSEDDFFGLSGPAESEIAPPSFPAGGPAANAPVATGGKAAGKTTTVGDARPVHKKKGNGAISINPTIIIGAIALLAIGLGLGWFILGPVKNNSTWNEVSKKATSDVESVVQMGLMRETLENIEPDAEGKRKVPNVAVEGVSFTFNGFGWGMPETAPFKGTSTQGTFTGIYNLQTGQVTADVEINGSGMAAKIVAMAEATGGGSVDDPKFHSGQSIKISGKIQSDGKVDVTVNGKRYPAK